jgi:hypothetical protein
VRRGGNLRHVGDQLHILRAVVEVVVADDDAKWFAAELAIFLLIKLAEQRALVPCGATVFAQRADQVAARDIQQPDLEVTACLRVADQKMQAAPGGFECLEFRVVQNDVDLLRELAVDVGAECFERLACRPGAQGGLRAGVDGQNGDGRDDLGGQGFGRARRGTRARRAGQQDGKIRVRLFRLGLWEGRAN